LTAPGGEDELAVRAGGLWCRRLIRAGHRAPRGRYQPAGTTLITAVDCHGPHVARWLAGLGAPHLLLVGPAEPGAALAAETTALGRRVTVARCALTSREALAALLAEHDVRGIFHVAGRGLDVRPLAELSPADLARALGDSARAAALLDELTADRPLDAFVLFS